MAIWLGHYIDWPNSRMLVDDEKNCVFKVLKTPSSIALPQYQEAWSNPSFWSGLRISSYFRRVADTTGLLEFKGKHYVDLGLTPDGYRMWRGVDKIEDSHDVALKEIYG